MGLLDVVLESVSAIADAFEDPEDDFLPVAFLQNEKETVLFDMHRYMDTETTKDLLSEVVLPAAILKLQVNRVVTVLSCWAVQPKSGTEYFDNDEPRPSQHPDRYEIVMVTELSADGVESNRVAYINRDPFGVNPPTISEFADHMADGASSGDERYEGRFVESVINAMKEVRDGV